MYYYEVAVPVNLNRQFTYMSDSKIGKGCRVLVDFNKKLTTGFVWNEVTDKEAISGIRIKKIIEVIDTSSPLPPDLLKIAHWISKYYFCSLGIAISAMLPAAIQVQTLAEIRLKADRDLTSEHVSDAECRVVNVLNAESWTNIEEVIKKTGKKTLYKILEQLEEAGFIEIKRGCDPKVKPKYANYIIVNPHQEQLPSLTAKQSEAYELIKSSGKDLALAEIADVISYAIIKALRQKGLISVEARVVDEHETVQSHTKREKDVCLTEEQKGVFSEIGAQLSKKRSEASKPFLLYGITGSGKTEVYIRLIEQCLKLGLNALVLVPEIALTPQMEEWFYSVFGDTIAILHSKRNERERWNEWKNIKSGKCRIVIGARSAVFAPLTNIGIIIVDEEHENSYKQDNLPRYNARDIAVLRASINNAVIVLGSATPSLESLNNVSAGKYRLLKLSKRPFSYTRPEVNIVNLRDEPPDTVLSHLLVEKINERLQKKEQILLLLNRRGYASYVLCMNCGLVHRCPKCDVSLIYHSTSHQLVCHYCGHQEKMEQKCDTCGSYVLVYGTAGTQQLEQQLKVLFPNAQTLRMDTDTTFRKGSYHNMFNRMKEGSVDILFGTQMIAKGLDFAKVTLVGVVAADNSLNVPDFRAAEKTFQLLTQVAGRSGRGDFPGEVIIQTYNPQHYTIKTAQEQDFDRFSEYELPLRKQSYYPPYYRLGRVIYSHKEMNTLQSEMEMIKDAVAKLNLMREKLSLPALDDKKTILKILGPVPTPINKVNERYRYHIILKASKVNDLITAISYLTTKNNLSNSIKVDIDIDPLSLL